MAPTNNTNAQTSSTRSAASALSDIAQSSHTPFLASTASITLDVLIKMQTMKSYKQELERMSQDIDSVLRGIISLELASSGGIDSPRILQDIGQFADNLNKLQIWLDDQLRTSKLRRLFRQNEEAAQLEACKAGIRQALETFGTRIHAALSTGIEAMKLDDEAKHGELLRLLAETDTESAHSTRSSLLKLGGSSGSLSLLPAFPKLFHGRDAESQILVNTLLSASPRVAILGPGGMGKTSLAAAVLHDERVSAKYPSRYFVACDSATTGKALVATVIRHISGGPPCLLVLDNFETPWEPAEGRTQVEGFLSLLADIPHLALLITMRGAERPGQVLWTRPFLPPLTPLNPVAARQTFIDIADDDSEVDELLSLTDNLPLAVNLVANVASTEGCANTLARLKSERTAALSDGYDKRSNLELSISLSLSSPRMQSAAPHALELLSLVSLLPDGISDADLMHSKLPIPELLKCKATLVRTSLAFIDHTERLRMLAPVREYIRTAHPPSLPVVRPLRMYFHDFVQLFQNFMHRRSLAADLVPRVASNLGNMHEVLLHGLEHDPLDLKVTVKTIILFDHMCRLLGRGVTPLLPRLPPFLAQLDDHYLHGSYITEIFQAWQFYPIPDAEKSVTEVIEHFRAIQEPKLEAGCYTAIAEYYLDRLGDLKRASDFFSRALALAAECGETVPQARALGGMASTEWFRGNYRESIRFAREQQRIGAAIGDTSAEVAGCRLQGMCATALGDFRLSAQALAEGREVIASANMAGSEVDHMYMNPEADVHQLKTEYAEARAIQARIVQRTSPTLAPVTHAYALVNVAFLDTVTSVPAAGISVTLDTAVAVFRAAQYPRGIDACDVYRADLALREGEAGVARAEYMRLFSALRGQDEELACCCLAKLADPTHASVYPRAMHGVDDAARWAAVFLSTCLRAKTRNSLTVHQALRCVGDVLACLGDDAAALSVLEVALDGFTLMDVHQSRAECMRSMADIYLRRGEARKAAELWMDARPLFERSQQTKYVARIDRSLSSLRKSSDANLVRACSLAS